MINRIGKPMEQFEIINTLKAHKGDLFSKYGVTRLGVFGSLARGEFSPSSDIDIVVEMPPDLFKMVHMKAELENLLQRSVDLIRYQKYLHTLLKRKIDEEAIYV